MRALAILLVSIPLFGQANSGFDWIQKIGSGHDIYTGLVTDSAGNSFVVGSTQSPDFPVKAPLQPTLATAGAADIFIVKIDAGGNVVFATCFGGSGEEAPSAIAIDRAGNLYVTGLTYSTDFPVTPGAYRTTPPPAPASGQRGVIFLSKINRDGSLGYSTYFATSLSIPKGIAVDGAGSVYISGTTQGDLPVTPGAYRTTCACGLQPGFFFAVTYSDGFAARFDAAGAKLLFATYLGAPASLSNSSGTSLAVAPDGSVYVGATSGVYWLDAAGAALLGHGTPKLGVSTMLLAPDGSLYLAGAANVGTDGFRPTPGAAQPDRNILPALDYQFLITQQTALVKMDGRLQGTQAATYFGGGYGNSILSLAMDASGHLLLGGQTAPRGLPTSAPLALGFGSPGTGFAAQLSPDLSAVLFSSYFGDNEHFALHSVAAGANGSVMLGGATSSPTVSPAQGTVWVNRIEIAPPQVLRVDSVRNAASRLDDPLSPGETIVVRGAGFESGARVVIGGTAVSPLSVTAREITAVLPADLSGDAVSVQVQSGGALSNPVLAPVAAVSPGLFANDGSGIGQGYILNQDGTRNGPDHPARPGEKITIFATGVGPMTFDQGYAVTANPVAVFVDIFYARGVAAVLGPVDGFPGDVYQLTVYVPSYEEIVAINADLRTFRYPPQVGVILRMAGRASQNGLAISIAQ